MCEWQTLLGLRGGFWALLAPALANSMARIG